MFDRFERMDMTREPERQRLRPIIWMYVFPELMRHRFKLYRHNMEGVKPPYLMLCSHNAFIDFRVAGRAVFPHRSNYVSAINAYVGKEQLVRAVGCICTRRYASDPILVRQLRRVVKRGDVAVMYPEARYTLCGTPTVLPDSIGKLVKFLKVPVVTLIGHGIHINSPFWSIGDRGVRGLTADMTCVLRPDEIKKLPADEINAIIREKFTFDDFRWQKENNIRVALPSRAEGLHKVLYQCPSCRTEYKMTSGGARLRCTKCGREWEMTELGELRALSGETEFEHIPDWYEWEREQVRREIEAGEYSFQSPVRVELLPNADGYVNLGTATLTHDESGITLEGAFEDEHYLIEKPVNSMYTLQIEYNYHGCGQDCIGLSTSRDSFYIYPLCDGFSVTKLSLAVEEMYKVNAARKKLEKEGTNEQRNAS